MKQCTRCEKPKSIIEFNRCNQTRDGLQRWCRECQSMYHKSPVSERRQPITITKEQLTSDIAKGLRNCDIAEKYGCSVSTITERKARYKLSNGKSISARLKKANERIKHLLAENNVLKLELEKLHKEGWMTETLPEVTGPVLDMDISSICRLARSARK